MHNRFESTAPDFSWLTGNFLVASHELHGTPFERSVVLILQQNESGVFGVIVNRPANRALKISWAVASGATPEEAEHLWQGGPMGGPVFALHPFPKHAEFQVGSGLYISASQENIDLIVHSGDPRYRIFCGVAGWRTPQLAEELKQGLWFPLGGNPHWILDHPEVSWEQALLRYGDIVLSDILGGSRIPSNPECN